MAYSEIRIPDQVDLSPGCKVMVYEGGNDTGTLQALMDWGFSFDLTAGAMGHDETLTGFKFEPTGTELETSPRRGDLLVRQISDFGMGLHIFHADGTSEHIRLALAERETPPVP